MQKITMGFVVVLLFSGAAFAQSQIRSGTEFAEMKATPQVISCGTKNGQRKEYPTPEAARADGATDITPKTGATCEATK